MAGVLIAGASLEAAEVKSSNLTVATPPVYVPNMSQSTGALPDGVLTWDATSKETNVTEGTAAANFVFHFSNASTNPVVILNVRPSCGCTTTKLPPLPWTIPPGANEQMEASVNLAGKSGTLVKSVTVYTDRGSKMLVLNITIQPYVMQALSASDRAQNVKMAQADWQAIFKGDCVTCHVRRGDGKYGQELYAADCAICHESEHRASMVPDLHALKTPTNYEFWRIWVTHGKPGSLMPGFSTADGGPLSDIQVASLASYLNESIKSH